MRSISVAAALLVCLAGAAQAQSLNFDQAAYITCREAHAMTPDARKALAGDASKTPGQVAAWTVVARVLLNLDETITKE